MRRHENLSLEQVRSQLNYNQDTGVFTWKIQKRGKGVVIGGVAGTQGKDSSWVNCIDGIDVGAHRLAWFYVHGYWPTNEIDHIDRDPSNNRLSNLRGATSGQNKQNTLARKSNKSTGIKGVGYDAERQQYQAGIAINKKRFSKRFDRLEDAIVWRSNMERVHHPFSPK
jgi:hypothetical protein